MEPVNVHPQYPRACPQEPLHHSVDMYLPTGVTSFAPVIAMIVPVALVVASLVLSAIRAKEDFRKRACGVGTAGSMAWIAAGAASTIGVAALSTAAGRHVMWVAIRSMGRFGEERALEVCSQHASWTPLSRMATEGIAGEAEGGACVV